MTARRRILGSAAWILGLAMTHAAMGQVLQMDGPLLIGNTGLSPIPYNAMTTFAQGVSGDMQNPGDLFVSFDIEIGGELYLNQDIFMLADPSPGNDVDQDIWFYNNNDRSAEYLRWDDSESAFALSDDVLFNTSSDVKLRQTSIWDIDLETGQDLDIMIDGPNDGASDWVRVYHDGSYTSAKQLLELDEAGNLAIRGFYSALVNFDLAEAFLMAEPAQPGDVVSLAPGRSDAVRLASHGDGSPVVGVVSGAPGMLLGGGFFDVADIEIWGEELMSRFEEERGELASEVLEGSPELALRARQAGADVVALFEQPGGDLSPAALAVKEKLESQILDRFARRHLAPVALAGRVPVHADPAFGAIEAGDPLTASPVPGIAMKADGPGPVLGIALEPLSEGPGKIMMMVRQGWIRDGGLARTGRGSDRRPSTAIGAAAPEAADDRIAELEARLLRLEVALAAAGCTPPPASGAAITAALATGHRR